MTSTEHEHYFDGEGCCIGQGCRYSYDDYVDDLERERDELRARVRKLDSCVCTHDEPCAAHADICVPMLPRIIAVLRDSADSHRSAHLLICEIDRKFERYA